MCSIRPPKPSTQASRAADSGDFASESAARDAWVDGFGGRIGQDETYGHTFEVAGDYPYFCIPHERAEMVGTVVVE